MQTSSGNFLVARTAPETFAATRTHENLHDHRLPESAVRLPVSRIAIQHGRQPVSGPAPRALRQFAASIASNVLTISV